jgi:hypothetical protein
MLDGGKKAKISPPKEPYLLSRKLQSNLRIWIIGEKFLSLNGNKNISPKVNLPTLSYVFEGYSEANKIGNKNFISLSSLSAGGLSNAWGCGVSCLSEDGLSSWPIEYQELKKSYKSVIKRIGISGKSNDTMADYFGLEEYSQDPIPMDILNNFIMNKYTQKKEKLLKLNFKLGRSRIAALSKSYNGRSGCKLMKELKKV